MDLDCFSCWCFVIVVVSSQSFVIRAPRKAVSSLTVLNMTCWSLSPTKCVLRFNFSCTIMLKIVGPFGVVRKCTQCHSCMSHSSSGSTLVALKGVVTKWHLCFVSCSYLLALLFSALIVAMQGPQWHHALDFLASKTVSQTRLFYTDNSITAAANRLRVPGVRTV